MCRTRFCALRAPRRATSRGLAVLFALPVALAVVALAGANAQAGVITVDYLVVGGGGAGGNIIDGVQISGGGGGAGGVLQGTNYSISAGTYDVLVGSGGTAGIPGTNGEDSSFASFTALGGGRGATYHGAGAGNGGSGGGGVGYGAPQAPGSGYPGPPIQGYDGAAGDGGGNWSGGGGGAGGAGSGTTGGSGITSSILTGTASTYAVGGAGGIWDTAGYDGSPGADGTGGGGGGAGGKSGSQSGGRGGDGIVIVSYTGASDALDGGEESSYTDGGNTYWVHKFLSSGTLTVLSLSPADAWWKGDTNDNWNTAGNWVDALGGNPLTEKPGDNTNVYFYATDATRLDTNTVDDDLTIKSLTFLDTNTAGVTINGASGKKLTIMGHAGTGVVMEAGSPADNTIAADVALGADQSWYANDTTHTLDVSGQVSGAYALTKDGLGKMILSSAAGNTYAPSSGYGTIVKAGTLLVNNTSGSGTGPGAVLVQSGGTLGGTGTISGSVDVEAGGELAPGASIGTLTVEGDVYIGGNLLIQVDSDQSPPNIVDLLAITGILEIDSSDSKLYLSGTLADGLGPFTFVTSTEELTGSDKFEEVYWKSVLVSDPESGGIGDGPLGYKLVYASGGGSSSLQLLAIPEPGTLALLGAGLLSLVFCGWRRMRYTDRGPGMTHSATAAGGPPAPAR